MLLAWARRYPQATVILTAFYRISLFFCSFRDVLACCPVKKPITARDGTVASNVTHDESHAEVAEETGSVAPRRGRPYRAYAHVRGVVSRGYSFGRGWGQICTGGGRRRCSVCSVALLIARHVRTWFGIRGEWFLFFRGPDRVRCRNAVRYYGTALDKGGDELASNWDKGFWFVEWRFEKQNWQMLRLMLSPFWVMMLKVWRWRPHSWKMKKVVKGRIF